MQPWVADFETTTTIPTRVWLWGACEVGNVDNFTHDNDIESFLVWVSSKKKVYFHNEKFDATFIIAWLLANGWVEGNHRQERTFELTMSSGGQIYSLKLYFKRRKCVEIRDSFKKFRMSVESVAKAFKLDIAKGSIDYELDRPIGYTPTDEEVQYVWLDVAIIAKALKVQFDKGLRKLTIGADALDDFKRNHCKNFDNLFPKLDLSIDEELRTAYKGGWVYCEPNKQYPNPDVGKGYVIDVNSLFPYVMYDRPMPYGVPVFFEGEYVYNEDYPIYIARIRADFTIKEGHLPTVSPKGSGLRFCAAEYVEDSQGLVELVLTSVDLELLKAHYHIHEIEYVCGYMFRASTELFKSYIDFWMEVKSNSVGGERQLAKLMLNNLYGKFGKNPDVTGRTAILEDGAVRYKLKDKEMSEPCYLPVAEFTTAYARDYTIRTAQKLRPFFCYSDTDSIHLTDCELSDIIKVVEIHETKLGAWALEAEFTRARFIRPKRYIEEVDGKPKVTCAGLSRKAFAIDESGTPVAITFDNFKLGQIFGGNLKAQNVEGGVLLKDMTFELR